MQHSGTSMLGTLLIAFRCRTLPLIDEVWVQIKLKLLIENFVRIFFKQCLILVNYIWEWNEGIIILSNIGETQIGYKDTQCMRCIYEEYTDVNDSTRVYPKNYVRKIGLEKKLRELCYEWVLYLFVKWQKKKKKMLKSRLNEVANSVSVHFPTSGESK